MTPPYGTRLILVADNLLDLIGTRDSDGRALSYQYGAPDRNGWYSPTVNAEDDGKVIVDRAELGRLRAIRDAASASVDCEHPAILRGSIDHGTRSFPCECVVHANLRAALAVKPKP